MQEEIKTYPFGAVWEEYCRQCGVAGDTGWLEEIKEYEAKVLSLRNRKWEPFRIADSRSGMQERLFPCQGQRPVSCSRSAPFRGCHWREEWDNSACGRHPAGGLRLDGSFRDNCQTAVIRYSAPAGRLFGGKRLLKHRNPQETVGRHNGRRCGPLMLHGPLIGQGVFFDGAGRIYGQVHAHNHIIQEARISSERSRCPSLSKIFASTPKSRRIPKGRLFELPARVSCLLSTDSPRK